MTHPVPPLPPTAAAELCRVQSALVEAFPECTDLSNDPTRGITRFTPHLSLGQWRNRAAAEAAVAQLGASWRPVEFEAGGVALISRQVGERVGGWDRVGGDDFGRGLWRSTAGNL